jgi:OOP family OmpA-OmpF porin
MGIARKGLIAALVGAGFAVSASGALAQAQQFRPGWYVGGSLGQADISDINCPSGFSCDDKDTAWRIFGGYDMNRNFAVELGYADLGEFNRSSGATNLSIDGAAWDISAIGSFPVADRFSVYGRLGLYYSDVDTASVGNETNTDLLFGVGARYDFSPNVGLLADWTRYSDVSAVDRSGPGGTVRSVGSDIDVLTLGVRVKF